MRFDAWKKAVREVKGDAAAQALGEGPRYTVARGEHDWVVAEIDRRLARVEPILDTADWLPLWAVEHASQAGDLRAVLNTDEAYEDTLRAQARANRSTIEALARFAR